MRRGQRPLSPSQTGKPKNRSVAAYEYVDANGKLLDKVVRFDPKDFRQCRPDANGKNGWTWNRKGVQRVLYQLPEVLQAKASGQAGYVVEGEKDAYRLARIGIVATTNAGGAGKWSGDYARTLAGTHVIIRPAKHEPD